MSRIWSTGFGCCCVFGCWPWLGFAFFCPSKFPRMPNAPPSGLSATITHVVMNAYGEVGHLRDRVGSPLRIARQVHQAACRDRCYSSAPNDLGSNRNSPYSVSGVFGRLANAPAFVFGLCLGKMARPCESDCIK